MSNDANSTSNETVCGSDVIGQKFLEPTPRWSEAVEVWGIAWDLHIYLLGVVFAIVAIVAFTQSILSCTRPKVPCRGFYVVMNLLVTVACLSKALNLLVDPYNSRCLLPRPLAYLLLHISSPCLTSTFYLLLVMLIKLSKLRRMGQPLFSPTFLVCFVIFNLGLGITADMVTGLFTSTSLFLIICFCYFLLLGFIISVAYFFVFGRLYSRTVGNRQAMNAMDASDNGRRPSQPELSTKMPMAVKVALAGAVFFVLISLVNLFYFITMMMNSSLLLEQKADEQGNYFKPWFWLAYQSAMRLSEALLCGLITFVTGLPLYKKRSGI